MAEISIKAEPLFHIGSFAFTNSYLLSLIVVAIFLLIAFYLHKKIALIPGKIQSIFEMIMEQALELMDTILGSRALSEKYLPLIVTIFLFVMLSNWLGLLPGAGSLGIRETVVHEGETRHILVPFLRAPSADLNFTIALAMISVIAVNALGFITLGFRRHASKFFNFKNPIFTFAGLLELVSEFVKIISFSFRLFGNVFAGEVLLIIIGFLGPYFLPLPFLFLEVFVGFIQAFIFAMLTLVFLAGAVTAHEEH